MTALLLAALLFQDSPEGMLRKIEETVEKAKTLQAHYEVQGFPSATGPGKATGTIELKQGNKVRISRTLEGNGEVHEGETVSDGRKLYRFTDGLSGAPSEPSKNLELQIRALFGSMCFMAFWIDPPDSADPKTLYKISELKAGADDGDLKTLEFTWTLTLIDSLPAKVRLWLDPKTWLVSKRTLTVAKEGKTTTLTETFTQVVLNADIPDATFEFVVDKKK